MTEEKLQARQQELVKQHEEATKFIAKAEQELEGAKTYRNQVEGGLEVIGGLMQEFFPKDENPEKEEPANDELEATDDGQEVDVEIKEETQEG